MPARPPRKCSIVGEGIVTLGVQPGGMLFDLLLQVFKVGTLDVFDVLHLADDADRRRREFFAAVGPLDRDRDVGLDAAELIEKVDVEVGAAELAVGDRLQAAVTLELHDVGDGAVFHLAQLRGADLALGPLLAGVEQNFGRRKLPTWSARKGGAVRAFMGAAFVEVERGLRR